VVFFIFFGARGQLAGRRYAAGLTVRSALQPPLAALVWPAAPPAQRWAAPPSFFA